MARPTLTVVGPPIGGIGLGQIRGAAHIDGDRSTDRSRPGTDTWRGPH